MGPLLLRGDRDGRVPPVVATPEVRLSLSLRSKVALCHGRFDGGGADARADATRSTRPLSLQVCERLGNRILGGSCSRGW